MSDLKKLRKVIQEEIKKVLNESSDGVFSKEDDPKSARNDAFDLTKQARSVAGYKAKIPAYEKALAAHKKAASLMKSPADKKEHLLAAKKLQTDLDRFKADINNNDGNFRSDMKDFGKPKNESSRDGELKRLKIQNKDVDLNLMLAGVQGEEAYKAGKERSPNDDHQFVASVDLGSNDDPSYKKQLVQAWYDGYDAMKEDLDESWMEDPKDLDESEFELGQWYQFDDDAYRVVVTDSSEVGLKSSSGKWMYLEPEELNDMLDSNKVQLISDKSEIAGLEFKYRRI